jgi:N-sulfoglucosamine sulfohydrolase
MMLQILKDAGEYENTIIVVTADNGMPFPYAKANLQEFGTHVPLAISGPGIKGKRVSNDLISMVDLTPTFLELGGAPKYNGLIGKSILPLLRSEKPASRKYVLTGRERHTHARPDNLGYPARAIRTHQYLYIKNFKPELWPQGDPRPVKTDNSVAGKDSEYKEIGFGYEDIDDSPSKASMLFNQKEIPHLFQIGFEKRPSEELYDIITDPFCLKNLAHNASFKGIKSELSKILMSELVKQGDPRTGAHGNVFDSYPRFGKMRNFAGFKQQGAYNEAFK